ncbi:MAG: cobalt ECF transporter T component CbiQ, partial [Firmicutes bacterium]|nr:cobalt ECF transporter T component CbiQ [Bacillota bacterium]
VTTIAGGVPLLYYFKLLLLPAGFLVLAVLTVAVIAVPNQHMLDAIWTFSFWNLSLGVTTSSLATAANLGVKALASVSCLYFLSLTTPMVDLIAVLRKLKFPTLLLELMSLIYRFIFVLMETAEMIFTSQASRLGYKNTKTGYRSLGQLISNLSIRSYKRANDLYTALEARGYTGELRVLEQKRCISVRNIAAIAVVDTLLIVVAAMVGGHMQ